MYLLMYLSVICGLLNEPSLTRNFIESNDMIGERYN